MLTNVQPAQSGRYALVVSNALGQATAFPATLTVGTAVLPMLTIERSGTNVIVSWPAGVPDAVLEQTSVLPGTPQDWTVVSGETQASETTIRIIVPILERAFFRLRSP